MSRAILITLPTLILKSAEAGPGRGRGQPGHQRTGRASAAVCELGDLKCSSGFKMSGSSENPFRKSNFENMVNVNSELCCSTFAIYCNSLNLESRYMSSIQPPIKEAFT